MENANIKFLVKPDSSVNKIEELSLPRDVAYFYFYLYYEDFTTITHNFYLNSIGSFTLTAGSSPSTTVTLTATKQYTDTKGTVHNFTITFTLTDGDSYAKIDFAHTTTIGLNRIDLSIESNVYPQGYGSQSSGGSVEAGGNTTYSAPLPYDNATFVYTADGDITKDDVSQATDLLIDNYMVCYSSDASVGFFSRYVDLLKLRMRSLNAGAERQYVWLDLIPRVNTKRDYATEIYFGAWAVGSSASIISAYNSLDKVMPVTRTYSKQENLIVRTDLNNFMYEYTERYGEILKNILDTKGNATLVPAGTPLAKFFKYRNKSANWNMTTKDTQADYVLRSINMANNQGVRLFVEVDIADNLWNDTNPGDTAIGVDEVTRLAGDDGNYYWVKLTELITSGKGFHDELINHITYLCQNYEFYGLVISECFYKDADYSSDAKTLFLADNPGYSDWPRDAQGNIDMWDDTLGQWKTEKLGQLWDEVKAIANANNKQFFVMVEPNFADEERQAREYGQYYPEAIKHCDGLWVWGYYGFFQVSYLELYKIVRQLQILYRSYPDKENIISIGLWGPAGTGGVPITSVELKNGLDALADLSWLGIGDGIEVTPTNSGMLEYMTTPYWLVLWGEKNSLCKENTNEFRNRYL